MLLLKIHRDSEPEVLRTDDQKSIYLAMRDGFVLADAIVNLIDREEREADEAWLDAHELQMADVTDAQAIQALSDQLSYAAVTIESLGLEIPNAKQMVEQLHDFSAALDVYLVENLPKPEDEDSEDYIPF